MRERITEQRGYVKMPNATPYRVTQNQPEEKSTMRELLNLIRAAIDAAPYYLQAKLDHWSTRLDPHLGETGGWVGDGFDETGGAELVEVEKFLDDVRSVESVLRLRHDEITEYLERTLNVELTEWQRNLIGVVYGPQTVEVEK